MRSNVQIYLPNGTESLADPEPGAKLFTYDISSATWLSDELQSGTGVAFGQAATAYDLGREVFWVYGGATYGEQARAGDPPIDEPKHLWKAPGPVSDSDCVVSSTGSEDSPVSACQVNTTTASSPSARGRPTRQASMVYIDVGMIASSKSPGSEGILILFGGQNNGVQVCIPYIQCSNFLRLIC